MGNGKSTCERQIRILMIGLDETGKTTILYRWKFRRVIETVTTIGFNMEYVRYKRKLLCVYDFGGNKKIRWLWYRYCHDVQAVVFVIDPADRQRLSEAKELFDRLLDTRELNHTSILVLANHKSTNRTDSMSNADIIAQLNLSRLIDRPWRVEAIQATGDKDDEMMRGFDWLWTRVNVKKTKTN